MCNVYTYTKWAILSELMMMKSREDPFRIRLAWFGWTSSGGWSLLYSLQWRHYGRGGVSNHQPYDCLLDRWFRRRSKKTSKLRVTGLCAGNSPGTGEFPAQMASNAEKGFIWWRHVPKISQTRLTTLGHCRRRDVAVIPTCKIQTQLGD